MYIVDEIRDGADRYVFIRDTEQMSLLASPTRYLKFKTKTHRSPNTVRHKAYSVLYYIRYLQEKKLSLDDVHSLDYDRQYIHFVEFLDWLKQGRHVSSEKRKTPLNATCNSYLREVFEWLEFRELQGEVKEGLKVRKRRPDPHYPAWKKYRPMTAGSFKGYLRKEPRARKELDRETIVTLLGACASLRDRVLLLLLTETGFRIGELLGVRFAADIDHERHAVRVAYRDDNENGARAKNAEQRSMIISDETYRIMMCYIAEYHELLMISGYLFVSLEGEHAGEALTLSAVYSIFARLEERTGIKASPHMFRHYFARERQKSGWDILLISRALGHKHLSTTELYLENSEEELEKASKEYNAAVKRLMSADTII